jgi:hypothetical protein
MAVGNRLKQIQLIGPFHAGFTSMETMISKGAAGLENLASGHLKEAGKAAAGIPTAAITNARQGYKGLQEYVRPGSSGDPEITKQINFLEMGGFRPHQDKIFQSQGLDRAMKSARQGAMGKLAINIPDAILDSITKPIMEHLVPLQKTGAAMDLAKIALEKLGPNPTKDQLQQASREVNTEIDNRMGQVNYDTWHMHRKVKDLMMLLERAPGWNTGTWKLLAGGIKNIPKNAVSIAQGKGFATHNTAYLISMLAVGAVSSALIQKTLTGKNPESALDLVMPQTAEKDANGNNIRMTMPTYGKELAALLHGVDSPEKLASNATEMGVNKLNPMLSAVGQLARNKDYFGTDIYDPDASRVDKLKSVGKFAAKQLIPFGAQNWQKGTESGKSTTQKVAGLAGFTQAPKRFNETAAQEKSQDLMDRKYGGMGKSLEQSENAKANAKLVAELRKNPKSPIVQKAVDDGTITSKTAIQLAKKAGVSPFVWQVKHMDADDAAKVYEVGTDAEKKTLFTTVRNHIVNSDKSHAEQDKLMADHKIAPPPELAIMREHKQLLADKKDDKYFDEDRLKKLQDTLGEVKKTRDDYEKRGIPNDTIDRRISMLIKE